ncbi:hypothetical protein AXF42_Ash009524 [Apostasia shenzhenica]|uniref:Uncharacterized protein n=1 Tax=Apostasia shenzhenica TaxID=1088818 RepID=A0A2I0B920_9ASPA|nr:hypothetical protein AXF42_Ash009524 [Apostasia shenzhenica]
MKISSIINIMTKPVTTGNNQRFFTWKTDGRKNHGSFSRRLEGSLEMSFGYSFKDFFLSPLKAVYRKYIYPEPVMSSHF